MRFNAAAPRADTLDPVDWPEPVERVVAFAREAGAEVRVEELRERPADAREAARAIGCPAAALGAVVVFDCDGRILAEVVPADRGADANKVAGLAGSARATPLGPDRVREETGFAPPGVAPFPLPRVERVFVDRLLLAQPLVWVGAGSDVHVAALTPGELVRLTRGESVDATS